MVANTESMQSLTESEFHQAIARSGDYWYSACLRITKNPQLAADAVQDALLNAWKKRHQFEQKALLTTWIHRIAVNSALSLLRSQHPERWTAEDIDVAADTIPQETLASSRQAAEQLNQAMTELTELERVCFTLKHLEQWRITEIAEELGSSANAIKQAVFRAVSKLRVSLADHRSE